MRYDPVLNVSTLKQLLINMDYSTIKFNLSSGKMLVLVNDSFRGQVSTAAPKINALIQSTKYVHIHNAAGARAPPVFLFKLVKDERIDGSGIYKKEIPNLGGSGRHGFFVFHNATLDQEVGSPIPTPATPYPASASKALGVPAPRTAPLRWPPHSFQPCPPRPSLAPPAVPPRAQQLSSARGVVRD